MASTPLTAGDIVGIVILLGIGCFIVILLARKSEKDFVRAKKQHEDRAAAIQRGVEQRANYRGVCDQCGNPLRIDVGGKKIYRYCEFDSKVFCSDRCLLEHEDRAHGGYLS